MKWIIIVIVIVLVIIVLAVAIYYKSYKKYDVTFSSKDHYVEVYNRNKNNKIKNNKKNDNSNDKRIGNEEDNLIVRADDVSAMNSTVMKKIIRVRTIDDIINTVKKAKSEGRKICIKGTKHSMGGQTLTEKGYQLDMLHFNQIISLDTNNDNTNNDNTNTDEDVMSVMVESGITWSDLIIYLDKRGLSPMILQSYSSFSVGGTISVNAHGITSDNSIYHSILKLTIIDSSGETIVCDRDNENDKNRELFGLVIGGYGLFGIITHVKLQIVRNVRMHMKFTRHTWDNFWPYYSKVLTDELVEIKFARININNFTDINLTLFERDNSSSNNNNSNNNNLVVSKVYEKKPMSSLSRLMYKWIVPTPTFQKLRFNAENKLRRPIDIKKAKKPKPKSILKTNTDDKIQNISSMKSAATYERNSILYESADAVTELYNPLFNLNATHILQEFFVPNKSNNENNNPNNISEETRVRLKRFRDRLIYVFLHNKQKLKHVSLLNITIRYVKRDTITMLKYAPCDMFAFVLYYRLPNKDESDQELQWIHDELTKAVLQPYINFTNDNKDDNTLSDDENDVNGTFYLPYRHHYSSEQLHDAYPNIDEFFALKKEYDPGEIFSNRWYENYKSN